MNHDDAPNLPHGPIEQACDQALGETVLGPIDTELAFELELAAAAATAAMAADQCAPMPTDVANRIRARLIDPTVRASSSPPPLDPEREPDTASGVGRLGWFAAAAAILIAAFAWFPPSGERQPASGSAIFARLAASASSQRAPWSLWPRNEANPNAIEVAFSNAVSGEVLWNEQAQEGVMVFENLPANDPASVQYQLWIIVPDQKHPIDGGVFDVATTTGKAYVRIDPKLPVHGAIAFAITMEKPGGVVVSDQDRRVVVAAPAKS